jgi:hypothetical protein
MFIAITMNHIRAIKAWGEAHGGLANLNVLTFELEVKARNRYFMLFPQFLANINGRIGHVPLLSREVTGFIGWLPYRPMRFSLTTDKLLFKQRLSGAGLATPEKWLNPEHSTQDYVIKSSIGSFGNELLGPYQHGQLPEKSLLEMLAKPNAPGSLYAEAFIQGINLKVWFWGDRAFHVHLHPYPTVTGDGRRNLLELIDARLQRIGQSWMTYAERTMVVGALKYQDLELNAVLQQNQQAWLDYRYGRRFAPDTVTEEEDNALSNMAPVQLSQITQAGRWVAAELIQEINAPVLYSLDGVLDATGKIWWLEVNSNPIFPPTGYAAMLSTLLGTPTVFPALNDVNLEPQIRTAEENSADAKAGNGSITRARTQTPVPFSVIPQDQMGFAGEAVV